MMEDKDTTFQPEKQENNSPCFNEPIKNSSPEKAPDVSTIAEIVQEDDDYEYIISATTNTSLNSADGQPEADDTNEQPQYELESEPHHEPEPEPETPRGYFMPINEMFELNDTMPKKNSVWGGIKEGSFGYIFGPSKSGKTIFCENLGLSLASGRKALMMIPIEVEKQKVLFVSLEEYWCFRSNRNKLQVNALKRKGDTDFEGNYLTSSAIFPRYLLSHNEWNLLKETIIQSESKIVFIDSLTRMVVGPIEESKIASAVSQKLRDMAYGLGVTMVVIHHTRKQYGQPLSIDSLAGSRVLAQEADFLIGINKAPDGTRYIKEVAFRYQKENDDFVHSIKIDNNCLIEYGVAVKEYDILTPPENDGRHDDTNMIIVLEEMTRLAGDQNNPMETKALSSLLVDTKKMSKPTFYKAIDKLLNKNKIVRDIRGNYQLKK